MSDAILLVGLGNPGPKYENNRHNIGFMAIERMAADHNFPAWKSKFQGMVAEQNIDGQKLILLKPMTYMNNSGQSVQAAAKFYKIPPAQIYVFHDELDLPAGKAKMKTGGGNAGHNGLKSTQQHLGTPDFVRVRLGIGHPGDKARVHNHVLGDFAKTDQDWLETELNALSDHLDLLLSGKPEDYISRVVQTAKGS